MTRKNTERIGTQPGQFVSLATFMGLLFAFLLWTLTASHAAPKWRTEVGIAAWCYKLSVMQAIIKADLKGDSEVALGIFQMSLKKGICRKIPIEAAAFRPKEIVEKIKLPDGSSFSIVKGNIIKKDESLGDEAFVMVQDTKIPEWQLEESAKASPFKPTGPRYKGWQNV